ncbi:TraB/VirB10 family protein [Candidatus Jidaibacter acanthamoebae]|nr:TraB/VirB10 family protein [Candidatus Jidaibacter acanthamoeba]
MDKILDIFDKVKEWFGNTFLASQSNTKEARKRQLRLGALLLFMLAIAIYIAIETDTRSKTGFKVNQEENGNLIKKIEIEELANGVSNEKLWTEDAEKKIEEVKQGQIINKKEQEELKERIEKDKVSKEELSELMVNLKAELEEKYVRKFQEEVNKIQAEHLKRQSQDNMESKSFVKKKKIKKVGDYIPALSYVEAKIIAGVDAGVGISAEADPDQVLMRITGKLVSAGNGANYIESNRLIGCLLLAKAKGNISSEKVTLQPVSMTCTKDGRTAIELPVKGYIASRGKSGIRGEVISREGDLVLKSFLAGIVGGFGSGVAQLSQTPLALTNGTLMTDKQKVQDIATRGLGAGVSSSSDKLLEYFIKKMEQYQPVISINEGIAVNVIFIEGFSLNEEDKNEK